MPHIYDNIELPLLPALRDALGVAHRADFCIGYFNLRGWKHIDDLVEPFAGGSACARVLIGMQAAPEDDLISALRLGTTDDGVDQAYVVRTKREYAKRLRKQLTLGVPTAEDEAALRRLARQLRAGKVVVKLFLRHALHAKLYLMFRHDPLNPGVGYVGSSNLTLAGLIKQGELNVDVLDGDAVAKLARWFEDRWNDRWCVDISAELAAIIEESWAREEPIPPYHIYLKMAYHLSEEARQGIREFHIPKGFELLCEHQIKAVQTAAGKLNRRGGVLVGDVVGLGKTLVGTAVARIFEDDRECECLILCPRNLVRMWEEHREAYGLRGRVLATSLAIRPLPKLRRYKLVLIDESHNFRNREGRTYRAVADYIGRNESACILMTATPYNMAYLDLASQMRLFIEDDRDLGIRPEALLRALGENEFEALHQCSPNALSAFEKSEHPDDWRELLRHYMVRRTRSFVFENYGHEDDEGRRYLLLGNGERSYCPERKPRAARFTVDSQYASLYTEEVVATVNALQLPRYGLGLYRADPPSSLPSREEQAVISDLNRAGKRLMGFCRTNLFKRLESSGHAFLLSVRRHMLRNELFAYAIDNGLELPIGTQDPSMLDTRAEDGDQMVEDEEANDEHEPDVLQVQAAELYRTLRAQYGRRFRWLRADLFTKDLLTTLRADKARLQSVLDRCPAWDSSLDGKLAHLQDLITRRHAGEKMLVFTQFADTVGYLVEELGRRGIQNVAGCTGGSSDPTALARRFSPISNNAGQVKEEIRVLIATDVLSEGQNLQDAHVVVSYDLPWAIIRLIQRAGRVDRIGQRARTIHCYSFLPAEGIEKLIHLRDRLRKRLRQNAEVVGTDERFFDDDRNNKAVAELYSEKAGMLDDDEGEVDLASMANSVWENAVRDDPALRRAVESLPDVVFSTKAAPAAPIPSPALTAPSPSSDVPCAGEGQGEGNAGVLVYLQTSGENHALAWIGSDGKAVTHSALRVFEAAACAPDTPAAEPIPEHHDLVGAGVDMIVKERRYVGGRLGRPSGARYRTYERLKAYVRAIEGTLMQEAHDLHELKRAIEDLYRAPLTDAACDALNRQLRSGIRGDGLADMVIAFRRDDRLCVPMRDGDPEEASVICSMGLRGPRGRDNVR
ncbi:MAG: NgoFVII family restriction endonuclease [Armatimonadetes bacterium]|nr:NgoFVII family restriction endonuclease [Armatimonadota bacterium]